MTHSLLAQDKIYDEQDIRDRDNAVSTIHRFAATKLQEFYRKKKKQRRQSLSPTSRQKTHVSENTPLLSPIEEPDNIV